MEFELKKIGNIKITNNIKCRGAKNILISFNDLNIFYPILDKEFVISNNVRLTRKKEIHLTIIGNKISKSIFLMYDDKEKYREDFEEIVNQVEELVLKEKISLTNNYSLLKRKTNNEIRFSIIREVKTTIVDLVYDILNKKYNLNLEKSYPHITLFKQDENQGIGLYSIKDYNKFVLKSSKNINELFQT